jgi:2-amino-4-hydroxy-6-hydroxymethyldihydropteridine diphosphokinase
VTGSRLVVAAVALGSNLGDRGANLAFATDRLRDYLSDVLVSPSIETAPVDVDPQPAFLNGALVGRTSGSPRDLLDLLLAIEAERGRTRPRPGAPRTLDLDLILFGDLVLAEPGLVVPHPRFRNRRFVLEPLAAIAPELLDPVTGRTVGELLSGLSLDHLVNRRQHD